MQSQQGYTLLELMVAVAIALPLLGSMVASKQAIVDDVSAQNAAANTAEVCRALGQRMTSLVRAGYMSTLATKATQADVDAAIAAQAINPAVEIPTLGDWVAVPDGSTRTTLRFQSANGVDVDNSLLVMTVAREFEFVLEPTEADNDTDDDGDGLVDEGSMWLRQGATVLQVAGGVELCQFEVEGRALAFELRCARRDNHGRVYRATSQHQIYLRNN